MTPLEELRRDLADVLGWLLVQDPGAGDMILWVTVTRPPTRRELGLVRVGADDPKVARWEWERLAAASLQALSYRTGVRTWDYITVERSPLVGELSAHRRLEAWRRIDCALDRAHVERRERQDPEV